MNEDNELFVPHGNKIIEHLYKTKPAVVGEGSHKAMEAIEELRRRLPSDSKEHYLLRHLAAVLGEFLLGEKYTLDPFAFEQLKEEREKLARQMARQDRMQMAGQMPAEVSKDEQLEEMKRLVKQYSVKQQAIHGTHDAF